MALTENLLRTDLNPMEEAAAYARLSDAFGLTHEAIALRLGRSRSGISNAIRLLDLPAPVQEAVAELAADRQSRARPPGAPACRRSGGRGGPRHRRRAECPRYRASGPGSAHTGSVGTSPARIRRLRMRNAPDDYRAAPGARARARRARPPPTPQGRRRQDRHRLGRGLRPGRALSQARRPDAVSGRYAPAEGRRTDLVRSARSSRPHRSVPQGDRGRAAPCSGLSAPSFAPLYCRALSVAPKFAGCRPSPVALHALWCRARFGAPKFARPPVPWRPRR